MLDIAIIIPHFLIQINTFVMKQKQDFIQCIFILRIIKINDILKSFL